MSLASLNFDDPVLMQPSSMRQVAAFLHVPARFVRGQIQSNKLKARPLSGKTTLVFPEDLRAWIQAEAHVPEGRRRANIAAMAVALRAYATPRPSLINYAPRVADGGERPPATGRNPYELRPPRDTPAVGTALRRRLALLGDSRRRSA